MSSFSIVDEITGSFNVNSVIDERKTVAYFAAELAKARKAKAKAEAKVKGIQAEINKQFETRLDAAQSQVNAAKADVALLTSEVRMAALKAHAETGEKSLVGGKVKIKFYKKLFYNADKALAYCREHLTKAVIPAKLDKKAFEKAVPVLDLDFVTTNQDPRAAIATDLSSLLVEDDNK